MCHFRHQLQDLCNVIYKVCFGLSSTLTIFNLTLLPFVPFNRMCHLRHQLQDLYNVLHKVYFGPSTLTIFYLIPLPFIPSPNDSLQLLAPPLGQDLETEIESVTLKSDVAGAQYRSWFWPGHIPGKS